MYITLVKFWEHPKNVSFMKFSQNIEDFRQNDSQLGFLNSYNSINKTHQRIISCLVLPKLYIAFDALHFAACLSLMFDNIYLKFSTHSIAALMHSETQYLKGKRKYFMILQS